TEAAGSPPMAAEAAAPLASTAIFEQGADRLLAALALMRRIRRFEEKVEELYGLGQVHGTMHLSIGQEAVAAGWSLALREDDYLLSHHRGHGHCLAKGAEARLMMAELLGREAGYCRGRGGSMHIADVSRRNLGANGIVGGGIPIATGVALSVALRGGAEVVLSIFGEGAVNEGAFHEAVNLAAIWNLPVIFLCENNQYAMSMPAPRSMRVGVAERAAGYGIPGHRVDGNDVSAVYEAVEQAAASCREGGGPWLVEALTYRHRGHSKSDRSLYRTRQEVDEWRRRDPVRRFEAALIERGICRAEDRAALEAMIAEEIEAAVAEAQGYPEPHREDLLQGVYAP
ncbi:MAG: thiamine pyrophosphate-dependent dehydrogenase E1 component subunit alpha, partial [Candidatus Dormibacteraceae bacterium]